MEGDLNDGVADMGIVEELTPGVVRPVESNECIGEKKGVQGQTTDFLGRGSYPSAEARDGGIRL
jgi:hypothetical protein